jgi:hypothetical protein
VAFTVLCLGRAGYLTWGRAAVRRGCGVCNCGEAWQLRAALRLRGGRFLSCLGKKGPKEAAFGLRRVAVRQVYVSVRPDSDRIAD